MKVLLVCALLIATAHADEISDEQKACYEKLFPTKIRGNAWVGDIDKCINTQVDESDRGPLLAENQKMRHITDRVNDIWFGECHNTTCTKPQDEEVYKGVEDAIQLLNELSESLPNCDIVREEAADLQPIIDCNN